MAENKNTKKAIAGFSKVKLFPIIENSYDKYEVGEGFYVPEASKMTMDKDESDQKIYGDDKIYLNMKSFNGITSNITFVEMELEMIEKLGFGKFDKVTKVLSFDPQSKNLEFGVTFRAEMASKAYRMYKMFVFTVNGIVQSELTTKGEGGAMGTYTIEGVFTKRKIDDEFADYKDDENTNWLDEIVKKEKIVIAKP